jgi:hypothetical protein
MIRLLFDRPDAHLKVYDESAVLWKMFAAGGDAWGNHGVSIDEKPPAPPYGHACWMPQGHFILGPVDVFSTPIASEGYGQIPILDMPEDTISQLIAAGKATRDGRGWLAIGGITLPVGQLAHYGREAVMDHCGGSNASDPFADDQGLFRTFGCTRMLNKDWRELAAWLQPKYDGNVIVFSAYGDPQILAG